MKKSLLSLHDVTAQDVKSLVDLAVDLKANPGNYTKALAGKTLLMIFEKPSLRTRLSFDVGIKQLGGFGIVVETGSTPLGKKESIEDTAHTAERYVDCIMARVYDQGNLEKMDACSKIPIINGLSNDYHPVQILSDLLTIFEKKADGNIENLKGIKLTYVGDALNNVTHSLLLGCALAGINIAVGCPKEAMPNSDIVAAAQKIAHDSGHDITIDVTTDVESAVKDADVIYTDSWMSYQIDPAEEKKRVDMFKAYQVTVELLAKAKPDCIFMNCLPAMRGYEQTTEVIDGKQSVVFDQAENRLHMQKAILLKLMGEK
jgi:ornithine carbamoyltransferase